jgi:hypothetical protein
MENGQLGKIPLTRPHEAMFNDEPRTVDPRLFASRLPGWAYEKPVIRPVKKQPEDEPTITDDWHDSADGDDK